jgi:hypothetical protein
MEAVKLIPRTEPRHPDQQHRCYFAWRFEDRDLTVILTGIGTGCLEPLLFEILDDTKLSDEKVAKRLVMIGTAGMIKYDHPDRPSGTPPLDESELGKLYVVQEAYVAGCAVALDVPVCPRFSGYEAAGLPSRTEISSDYYYAATLRPKDSRRHTAQDMNPSLREGLENHWEKGRLVSMESAQFYHFARTYGRQGETEYVAIRGAANFVDEFDTQGGHSGEVLRDALDAAMQILGVSVRAR